MTAVGRRPRGKIALENELRNESLRAIRTRRLALNVAQDLKDESAFDRVDESFRLKFDGSNLSNIKLWHCDFTSALFRQCDMRKIVFWRCDLSDVKFDDSSLVGAIFFDCCLDRATFSKNDMSDVQLSKVTLRGARFHDGVSVRGALVLNTDLEQVDPKLRPNWAEAIVIPIRASAGR